MEECQVSAMQAGGCLLIRTRYKYDQNSNARALSLFALQSFYLFIPRSFLLNTTLSGTTHSTFKGPQYETIELLITGMEIDTVKNWLDIIEFGKSFQFASSYVKVPHIQISPSVSAAVLFLFAAHWCMIHVLFDLR